VKLAELVERLNEAGVRPDAYCFEEVGAGEQYCLARSGSKWVTYYAERGTRTSLREFETEEAACAYFLAWVVGDPTTRLSPNAHIGRRDA